MKLFKQAATFNPVVETKDLKHCASSSGGGSGGGGGVSCDKPEDIEIRTSERSFTA